MVQNLMNYLNNLKRNKMKYLFRPYEKMQAIEVTLTGKVYEKGEHPLYTEHKIIEVVDKESETHYAFEDELKSDEVKEQERSYSEEEVLPIVEYIQWVIRKIDKGNTPEEIVRLLLFNREKIEQFKKK
jgi:hypothetical protein